MGTPRERDTDRTSDEQTSTGTGAADDTGADRDDEKAGMRPTGSGGSPPPSQSR
jgi:hypothetical protein